MSNTTTYEIEIVLPKPQLRRFSANIRESPCMKLLAAAIQRVACEHGGTAQNHYRDCTGTRHHVSLGLATPELPRGMGVEIDRSTGKMSLVHDATDGNERAAEQVRKDIARVYAVLATLRSLKSIHYSVRVVDERRNNAGRDVTVEGVQA